MPTQIVSTTSVAIGDRLSLVPNDDAYVAAGVLLASIDANGIISANGSHGVTVAGEVYGQSAAINLIGSANEINSLTVRAGGAVAGGGFGAYMSGYLCTVANYGTISGHHALAVYGLDARIVNHGTISTTDTGSAISIGLLSAAPGHETMAVNFGTISSAGTAYYGDAYYKDTLQNHGTIVGHVLTMLGDDVIVNRGKVLGDVDAGGDNDRVDNNGGHVLGYVFLGDGTDTFLDMHGTVSGKVLGEAGNDTMYGNATEAEVFDGGTGVDTLDFRYGPAVTLALDLSFENDGAALGDTYMAFEYVIGSAGGADMLRGDGGANSLTGMGGRDSLDGAGGADILRGGNGVDTLTGGTGDDVFRYYTLGERGDGITDFTNVAGNDDKFQISAAGFGGGLTVGALVPAAFQSRADNVAQDANDRFIFRTTDQTLWYDADGNGAGAALMLADLQAGATMTFADITVI
jgi:Ca2+-binding RTX toxin-like protein